MNKPGFYLVMLKSNNSDSTCNVSLSQYGTGVYNFVSHNGSMDTRIAYLNTISYKINTNGSIDSCYIYDWE